MFNTKKARGSVLGFLLMLPISLISSRACAASQPVELLMGDAPPLTITNEGNRHGIVGDVVLRALAESGYSPEPRSLPWARAQKYALEQENVLIIPLSRTPEREHQFTWVAPIFRMERAFFSLKYQVKDFEEARQRFKAIAVGMGSAQEQTLLSKGFMRQQIYPIKIGENPAQLLLKGRVDAWFNGIPESRYIWAKLSSRPLLMSAPLVSQDVYLACSKVCDATLVSKIAKAIGALRKNGFIDETTARYLHKDGVKPGKKADSSK